MKYFGLFFLAFLFSASLQAQDVFVSSDGKISFFSETPVENIDATSKQLAGAINIKTKKVYFKAVIKSFVFKKGMMQEHFNENYMESDKYPNAIFNGQINEDVDLTRDGTYEVTVSGKLTIHGVDQDRNIKGTITVKGGQLTVHSDFMVKVADHKIDIPTIMMTNIAEEVKVTLDAVCAPYVEKK